MSGLFGSITIKGNRLTDFAGQTSTVGIPIPFGFGRFPVEGNVIFAPMPPKEHVKKKKQGKGGVKSEEYSYTLSYAVAFCEGPIFGYLTIKRSGKVVWTQDPNASVDDLAYAAKWAQKATFYYGTETQLPDSTIESYKGSGMVSGHRGIAYIVVEDDDVTDNGGAVPTYEAVVIANSDVYLTTPPYSLETVESIGHHGAWLAGRFTPSPAPFDGVTHDNQLLYGELRAILQTYEEAEAVSHSNTIISGSLRTILIPYSSAEAVSHSTTLQTGILKVVLVPYTCPPEGVSHSTTLINGTLA